MHKARCGDDYIKMLLDVVDCPVSVHLEQQ
jgi:hypothetical protein